MSPWSFENQMNAIQTVATHLSEWMQQTGVQETVMDIDALGERVLFRTRAFYQGRWIDDEVPDLIVREATDARAAMAQLGGGAWTKGHFAMKSNDYRLTTDFDYDSAPTLDPPYTLADCATELRLSPRRPETTPDWLHA